MCGSSNLAAHKSGAAGEVGEKTPLEFELTQVVLTCPIEPARNSLNSMLTLEKKSGKGRKEGGYAVDYQTCGWSFGGT